jgi:hypothetical protein
VLIGSEGVATAWLAEALEASAAEGTRFFVAITELWRDELVWDRETGP